VPGATVCFGPGDLVPIVTIQRDVARLVTHYVRLPLAVVHSAPAGRTLVNLPTVLWATFAHPGAVTVTIDGASVTIRVRPVRFTWTFGDGSGGAAGVGRPYTAAVDPAADPGYYLTHQFRDVSGADRVTLAVAWAPTYTIEGVGGEFTTVQVSRVSAAVLDVLPAQAVLTGNS
jgi:hypothetical protein